MEKLVSLLHHHVFYEKTQSMRVKDNVQIAYTRGVFRLLPFARSCALGDDFSQRQRLLLQKLASPGHSIKCYHAPGFSFMIVCN